MWDLSIWEALNIALFRWFQLDSGRAPVIASAYHWQLGEVHSKLTANLALLYPNQLYHEGYIIQGTNFRTFCGSLGFWVPNPTTQKNL